MKRDQIALESVRSRLLLGWGKAIASRSRTCRRLSQSLAAQQAALVRVDVPLGERPKAPPTGGRVAPLAAPENLIEAQYLGPAPSADPQTQSRGFCSSRRPIRCRPGTAVVAWLAIPGPAQSGVIVPRDAVLRHEGETFVYLQTAEDTFQRKGRQLWSVRPATDGLSARASSRRTKSSSSGRRNCSPRSSKDKGEARSRVSMLQALVRFSLDTAAWSSCWPACFLPMGSTSPRTPSSTSSRISSSRRS